MEPIYLFSFVTFLLASSCPQSLAGPLDFADYVICEEELATYETPPLDKKDKWKVPYGEERKLKKALRKRRKTS